MQTALRTLFVALTTAVTLSACGESDGGPNDDGRTSTDAGVIHLADAGAGITKSGFVTVTQVVGAANAVASLCAIFTTSTGRSKVACSSQAVGDCVFEDCLPNYDAGMIGSVQFDSAGELTMTGSLFDGGLLTLKNSGTFDGYNAFVASTLFTGDEMLTLSASGSDAGVPAFSSTIVAPSKLTVTAPVCASNGCPNVNRGGAMTFNWSANGQTGRVIATIEVGVNSMETQRLVCKTDVTTGSLTIPPTTLSLLKVGATGSLLLSNVAEKQFAVGAYLIQYQVSTSGLAGSTTVR